MAKPRLSAKAEPLEPWLHSLIESQAGTACPEHDEGLGFRVADPESHLGSRARSSMLEFRVRFRG